MTEFTFMFRGRETGTSPEQTQKTMEKWMVWFKDLDGKGHLKDPGHPLEHSGAVIKAKGNEKLVSDGPYAEAKDVIGGYIVVSAKDLAEAVGLAKECPIFDAGGSVEVRPIQKLSVSRP